MQKHSLGTTKVHVKHSHATTKVHAETFPWKLFNLCPGSQDIEI